MDCMIMLPAALVAAIGLFLLFEKHNFWGSLFLLVGAAVIYGHLVDIGLVREETSWQVVQAIKE